MISKLITFGANRHEAIARMKRAISEYRISGVHTTLDFAEFVLDHKAFVEGDFDTHFVSKYFTENSLENEDSSIEAIAAAAVANILQERKTHQSVVTNETTSRWKSNRS